MNISEDLERGSHLKNVRLFHKDFFDEVTESQDVIGLENKFEALHVHVVFGLKEVVEEVIRNVLLRSERALYVKVLNRFLIWPPDHCFEYSQFCFGLVVVLFARFVIRRL